MNLGNIVKEVFVAGSLASCILVIGYEKQPKEEHQYVDVQPKEKQQYVDSGTADMRGTWYKHGSRGGWFGPYNEYGFGWFYLKQYGKSIEGKYEYELYGCNQHFVRGTINDGNVSLSTVHSNCHIGRNISISGIVKDSTVVSESNGQRIILEKTSRNIKRKKTPGSWRK